MQIIDRIISLPTSALSALEFYCNTTKENFCFFDIETTGLSPKVSSLYLIGAMWYEKEENQFHTRQWFADDYSSEQDILLSFDSFLKDFTVLVHYNGGRFDIPYVEKKCQEHEISSPFCEIQSLDLYPQIRPLKTLLRLPDLKLKTVESLSDFVRTDCFSGKDCIEIYSRFMQKKVFRDESMNSEKEKLLLHNRDDLAGTYFCAQLLYYTCSSLLALVSSHLTQKPFSQFAQETETSVSIRIPVSVCFPFPVKYKTDSFTLELANQEFSLQIPLVFGTFYHFFPNYKDYYYLPSEDTAVHKSVGAYVDKEFRELAKASTCYLKKEALFLPVPSGFPEETYSLFRPNFKSKQNYILWEEKTKQDTSLWESILSFCLNGF